MFIHDHGDQGVQDEPSQSARPAAEVPAMAQEGVTHPFGSRPNEPSGSRRGTEERESSGDDDEGELLKGTDIPKEAFEKAVEVFPADTGLRQARTASETG